MDSVLKQVREIKDEVCVTLILNTHRTHPDSNKDALVLKNLQKEAEKVLSDTLEKRPAWRMIERMESVVEKIDHRHNLESLIVFVSETVATYTRLPIAVTDRVAVERSFAIRDLVRAMHMQQSYYTLVLGKDRARLIEAADERVTLEIGRPFPIINNSLFVRSAAAASNATRVNNYQLEFFNLMDDALWAVWRGNPHPIVVAGDEKTYARFEEVSEHTDLIIGVFNDDFDKSAQHIVEDNWHIVKGYTRKKNEERIAELQEALNGKKALFGIDNIWKAIRETRGQTLFVKDGYYLRAKIAGDNIVPLSQEDAGDGEVIDDVINEMIEVNAYYGGDTVFIFDGGLDEYGGLALVVRY